MATQVQFEVIEAPVDPANQTVPFDVHRLGGNPFGRDRLSGPMDGPIGKLTIPTRKSADWLNYLISPKQGVILLSAENQKSNLILYFKADARLYQHLNHQLNPPPQAQGPQDSAPVVLEISSRKTSRRSDSAGSAAG